MEMTGMNIQENRNFLRSVAERRWTRFCQTHWPSAAAMRADLESRNVIISERTAENYRQGQLPALLIVIAMINAGYWPSLQRVFEPFIQAGGIAALEAELNDKKREVMQHERELEELRRANRSPVPDCHPADW